jgi:hypothetical protein
VLPLVPKLLNDPSSVVRYSTAAAIPAVLGVLIGASSLLDPRVLGRGARPANSQLLTSDAVQFSAGADNGKPRVSHPLRGTPMAMELAGSAANSTNVTLPSSVRKATQSLRLSKVDVFDVTPVLLAFIRDINALVQSAESTHQDRV